MGRGTRSVVPRAGFPNQQQQQLRQAACEKVSNSPDHRLTQKLWGWGLPPAAGDSEVLQGLRTAGAEF